MNVRRATAIAHPNLALVKYWGKADADLIIPMANSLSVTLGGYTTTTTVKFDPHLRTDEFYLQMDSQWLTVRELNLGKYSQVVRVLDLLRARSKKKMYAYVYSQNDFPTSAGLASSASGLAALTVAGAKALELDVSKKELSMIARQGSGSACRSLYGGFVEWVRGEREDGSDSYAQQWYDENYWLDFRVLTAIVDVREKTVSSREGMARTLATSSHYRRFLGPIPNQLHLLREGLRKRDIELVGKVAEESSNLMHDAAEHADPPIVYRSDVTREILHNLDWWRREGLQGYGSCDAGPQVKVLCLEEQMRGLEERLWHVDGVQRIVRNQVGCGAKVIEGAIGPA